MMQLLLHHLTGRVHLHFCGPLPIVVHALCFLEKHGKSKIQAMTGGDMTAEPNGQQPHAADVRARWEFDPGALTPTHVTASGLRSQR
jgi:hypothetical protein